VVIFSSMILNNKTFVVVCYVWSTNVELIDTKGEYLMNGTITAVIYIFNSTVT
jgi:hypothetical protein